MDSIYDTVFFGHVKDIWNWNPHITDRWDNTILHLTAKYPNNDHFITYLLEQSSVRYQLLYEKNFQEDTCIETAFLHSNNDFIKKVVTKYNLQPADFVHMKNLTFYAHLIEDINPHIEKMLFGKIIFK